MGWRERTNTHLLPHHTHHIHHNETFLSDSVVVADRGYEGGDDRWGEKEGEIVESREGEDVARPVVVVGVFVGRGWKEGPTVGRE